MTNSNKALNFHPVFNSALKSDAVIYADSSFLLDTRFNQDFYPQLKAFNASGAHKSVKIQILASCMNHLNKQMHVGNSEISEQARFLINEIREQSYLGNYFICNESTDKQLFSMEMYSLCCRDKLKHPIYVLTQNKRLRADLEALDNAESYVSKDDIMKYSERNFPITVFTMTYQNTLDYTCNQSIRPLPEKLCKVTNRTINFEWLSSIGAQLYVDCNFLTDPGFMKCNEELKAFNAGRPEFSRLHINLLPTVINEVNKLAFKDSLANTPHLLYARDCIRECMWGDPDSNFRTVDGNDVYLFFDASFLSAAVERYTESPVAILTNDYGLKHDSSLINHLQSIYGKRVFTFSYNKDRDVCLCKDPFMDGCA